MMVRTQISLTEEQHAAVHSIAEERGESMSAVIRDAVDRLVELSHLSAIDLLRDMAGKFSDVDGATDVSENHDAYYAQAIEEHLREKRRRWEQARQGA